jgi:NlpC/P60 family putative phage cell wall peptidase
MLEAAARHLLRIPVSSAEAGDVAVFRLRPGCVAKHAGILTSPSSMLHAMEGAAVAEVALGPWWRRRIAGAFRFPNLLEGH